MSDAFDAYHMWLGIGPEDQPPNHYRLLGIPLFEGDSTVIESSADRQMGHLRSFQLGTHAGVCQKLLNEVAAARVCLLTPRRKAEYDRELRERLGPKPSAALHEEAPATQQPLADFLPADLLESGRDAARHSGRAKTGRKRSNATPVVLAACGAAGAVALCIAAIVWLLGGSGPSDRAAAKGGADRQPQGTASTPPVVSHPAPSIKTPAMPAGLPAPPVKMPAVPPELPAGPSAKTDQPPVFPPAENERASKDMAGPDEKAPDDEAIQVYAAVQGSLAALENAESCAAGTVLDATGLVLTNAHVVVSPLPLRCRVELRRDNSTEVAVYKRVKILGVHPTLDLAVVRIDPAEHKGALQPAPLAAHKAAAGRRAYAIGNPLANAKSPGEIVTPVVIGGEDRTIDGVACYQLGAAIDANYAGGLLCDTTGAVLGLLGLPPDGAENAGYAIPLDTLAGTKFVPLAWRASRPEQFREYLAKAERCRDRAQDVRKQKGGDAPEAKENELSATRFYHLALLCDPCNDGVYYNRGEQFRELDVNEAAVAYLVQAIELAPWGREQDSSNFYRELGLALVKQKRKEEAAVAWREGVTKFPSKAAKIWEDLAIFYANDVINPYECAYAAAVVVHLADPYTRIPVAQELLRDFGGRLSPAEKKKLDAAIARIPEDLREGQAAAEKMAAVKRPYMTEWFAKYMQDSPILKTRERAEYVLKIEPSPPPAKTPAGKAARQKPAASEERAAKPMELDLTVPAGSVDLLREIDLARGAVKGQWKFSGQALATPVVSFARLEVPTKVPEEYDLTLIVERKANRKELVIGLVRDGAQTAFFLDGADGQSSGFDPAGPGAYHGAVFKDKPVTLVLKVRREGLMAIADGKQIFFDRGTAAFPSVPEAWKVHDGSALFIGSNSSKYLIHKWMLTPQVRKE